MFEEKRHNLADPIATCGDRVYVIGSQNGLFADSWGGHVPSEMHGVWDHPIKLLDGFWFALAAQGEPTPQWLSEAAACRAYPTYTEFDYVVGPIRIIRRDFVPDGVEGLVVTLTLTTREAVPAPLTLTALFRSDLRPSWLGEQLNLHDAQDRVEVDADKGSPVTFVNGENPWTCIVGADRAAVDIKTGERIWGPQVTHGLGISAQLEYDIQFVEGAAQITFFVAGAAEGVTQAQSVFDQLRDTHAALFEQKRTFYQNLIDTSRVITPDAALNNALAWTKINAQWLARTVPAFGTGVGAGFPEYPWWFGIDSAYAVLPMLQAGQFELVKETLLLLHRESLRRNPNEVGRVIHEMSSNGVVFNEGNAMEVPTFVRAVHQYWQWTGDDATLRALYPFCKQGVLEYLLKTSDADGDLCPSGRSIIETLEMHSGIECLDVAAYTSEALLRLSDMAAHLQDDEAIADYQHKAEALSKRIREEWWLEGEGLFADARASTGEVRAALATLDARAATVQSDPNAHDFLRQVRLAHELFAPGLAQFADAPADQDVHWFMRHWVVMCPVEVGIATAEQAQRTLNRLQTREFCNEVGMYLHPDRHDVMSINTGMLALSAARYGYIQDALRISHTLAEQLSYRTPGTICEALPGQWCFLQLWSNLGIISPTVECFLGIEPDVARRKLRVVPQLPKGWDHAEVQRLRIGDAHFDIRVARTENQISIEVSSDAPSANPFELELGVVLDEAAQVDQFEWNGQPTQFTESASTRGRQVTHTATATTPLKLVVKLG